MTAQWYKNGTAILGVTTGLTYTIKAAKPTDAGKYKVVVKNAFGTVTSYEAMLTVVSIPGGGGTGLKGYYYSDTVFAKLATTKLDPMIDFAWGSGGPLSEKDNWGVRWYGELYIPKEGDYLFCLDSNDGARLFLDGKLEIDNWYYPDPKACTKLLHFDTIGKHVIRLDYWEGEGDASIKLTWITKTLDWDPSGLVPIQKTFLYPLDFNPPKPNVEVGDVIWIDAQTGAMLEKISTKRE